MRKSNIEALRIIAMFMIVMHHLIAHGLIEKGAQTVWKGSPLVNRIASVLYYPGGVVGVFVFFMITGYFLIERQSTSIKKVVIEMYIYSWLMIPLFLVGRCQGKVFESVGNGAGFLKLLVTPVFGYTWWFATCYVLLILMVPMINSMVQNLSRKEFTVVLCILFLVWYMFGYITDLHFFGLQKAIFCYLVGGYYKKYKLSQKINRRRACLIIVSSWCGCSAIEYYRYNSESISLTINLLQNVVLVTICSVALFAFFESMDIRPVKCINKVAGTTFAVYLLHDNFVTRDLLWVDLFQIEKQYATPFFPITSLATGAVIFAACYFVDRIRLRISELLKEKVRA